MKTAKTILDGSVREGLSIDERPEGGGYGRAARKRKSDPESGGAYSYKLHLYNLIVKRREWWRIALLKR
jgi:hypothetical protein